MKTILICLVGAFAFFSSARAQQSDFIVLKKHNNRTLKTYAVGSFLAGETHNGFKLSGYIKDIRNDSIYMLQQQTQLVGTDFGSKVDTISYTIGFDYRDIKIFNFGSKYKNGKKKGFVNATLPKIMIIGGLGYAALELINSAYRGESLNENNKMAAIGISLGVAAAGFIWVQVDKGRNKAGGKYKVVYMKVK